MSEQTNKRHAIVSRCKQKQYNAHIYIYIFLYKYDVQIQKLAIGPRKLFLLQLFLFYQNVYVHSFLLLFGFLLDFCCC